MATLGGWVLFKSDREKLTEHVYEAKYCAIDNGYFVAYNDENKLQVSLIAFVNGGIQRTGQVLDTGNSEHVVRLHGTAIHGDVTIELGIAKSEFDIWIHVLELHSKIYKNKVLPNIKSKATYNNMSVKQELEEIISSLEIDSEDVHFEDKEANSVEIQFAIKTKSGEKKLETIELKMSDDIESAVGELMRSYENTNNETHNTLKNVLYRSQNELLHSLVLRLKKHVGWMKRRSTDLIFAEQRAVAAETHAVHLSMSLEKIEILVHQLSSHNSDVAAELKKKDDKIASLHTRMLTLKEELRILSHTPNKSNVRLDHFSSQMSSPKADRGGELPRSLSPNRDNIVKSVFSVENKNIEESLQYWNDQTKKLRQDRAKYAAKLHTAQNEIKRLLFYIRKLTSSLTNGDKKYREIADSVATGVDDDLSHVNKDNEPLELRLQAAENRALDLKAKLRAAEAITAVLTQRCDGFAMNLRAASAASKRSQEELTRMKENYTHAVVTSKAKIYKQENAVLREQAMNMRAEVLRLQAEITGLGQFAISAVESLAGAVGETDGAAMAHLTVDGGLLSSALAQLRGKFSTYASSSSSALLREAESRQHSSPSPDNSPSSFESRLAAVGSPLPPSPFSQAPLSVTSRTGRDTGLEILLSPVAQDRLLRNIYCRYIGDTLGYMNLTRFARFVKEFDLVGNSADRLISGEIDIIFHNSRAVVPEGEEPIEPPPRAFGVRAGADVTANRSVSGVPLRSPRSAAGGTHHRSMNYVAISPGQFIVALQAVASRMYAGLIEDQLGAALECLPPKQRSAAAKAAMDVLITKRIIPMATELGIMENMPIIFLDEALRTMYSAPDIVSPGHARQTEEWFRSYSSPRQDMGGMRYKALSKFAHDFSIVPYLLREPQLYDIFREVLLWYNADFLCLDKPLPTDMAAVPIEIKNEVVEQKMHPQMMMSDVRSEKRGGRQMITLANLKCFEVILASTAMQAFPDLEKGLRIASLFDWAASAAGGMSAST